MKIARLPGRSRSAVPASTTVTGLPQCSKGQRRGQPDRVRRRRRSCGPLIALFFPRTTRASSASGPLPGDPERIDLDLRDVLT